MRKLRNEDGMFSGLYYGSSSSYLPLKFENITICHNALPISTIDPKKMEGEISLDIKLEDLLAIYDQEKLKYLSSFVS